MSEQLWIGFLVGAFCGMSVAALIAIPVTEARVHREVKEQQAKIDEDTSRFMRDIGTCEALVSISTATGCGGQP